MLKKISIFIFTFFLLQNVKSQVGPNSLVFNGTSDYYSVQDNSSLDLSGNATIEFWINPCDTINRVVLSKHWCAAGNGSYFVQILNGAIKWGWVPYGGCTGSSIYITNNGIIRNNEWQHIAIVHTPTSVNIYKNGLLQTGSLTSGVYSGIFKNNSEPLRVGVYKSLSGVLGPYYTGRLDELRVWNAALSSAQILARKNLSLIGNETNLVLYHNFDTDTNRTIQNKATSSGATNNGLTTSLTPFFLSNSSTYPVPFSLGNDTNLCSSPSLSLDAGSSPYSYLWDNSTNLRYRTVNSSGIYIASVFNQKCIVSDTISVTFNSLTIDLGPDTLLCNSNSLILNATTPGCSYLWNNGSINSTYAATTPGNHWVTITNGVCSFTDTINIMFDSVDLTFMNDTTICMGDSVLLSPTTTATNYLWSSGETTSTIFAKTAGIYWIEVTKGGCTKRDSMELFVNNNSFSLGNDTIICSNNQLILDAFNPGSTYLWNTGSTNSSITVSTSGVYSVSIMNVGCSSVDTINVGFQNLVSSFGVSDTSGCEPLSLVFNDLSIINFGAINNWNWTFGDGTFSSSQNPSKTYSTPGLYTVHLNVTSNFGCLDDTIISSFIRVNPKPNADFLFGGNSLFSDELINFNNISTQANSYFWDFGDGGSSILLNPIYSYSAPGIYDITLIATNSFNCFDTISYQVVINEESKLFIPNSFTPNGDGLNENWQVHGLTDSSKIQTLVFNRWGELIFESNSISGKWDGTFKGEKIPSGIYSYKVRSTTFGNIDEHFGHINLIR